MLSQIRHRYYLKTKEKCLLQSKAYYQRHKWATLERHRKYYNTRVRILNKLKDTPCLDCHIKYPPCIMQFDHRPGSNKVGNLSQLVRRQGSMELLYIEAKKGDIVCANCHSWRTYKRRVNAR